MADSKPRARVQVIRSPSPPSSPELAEAELVEISDVDPLAPLEDDATEIDLVHCRLSAIPPSLSRFAGLKRLCVRQNQLAEIPADLFPADGVLEELDTYDNKLKNDTVDLLLSSPQMKNLRTLDLSFNLIKAVPPTISSLSSLETVYFVQNKISKIGTELSACTRLRSLELGGNRIRDLAALPSLPALEELWLGKNKITSLAPLKDIALPKLRILSIQSNRITKIEALPPSLEELYLSHNGVEVLEGLEVAPGLTTVDIGANFITEVKPEAVAHLGKIEELWMNNNKIESLPQTLKALEPLKTLNTVYLEGNPCQATEGAAYRRKIILTLPWLEQVDATFVVKK
ncbi:L domain-like protein [Cylindrobasidium torrendii FP15055 ss-10]|uniref:L domain-like protein n=1 Tax=Cylindrobasidium torrendii FP15055 ss-10 TaxID=1314674 RepID=A0A0D7BD73_9AGAR|nr:L domain-like protein [Cylindrobasidium torrendii FP15055 ss-10]